jgi:hypothetical protein
MSAFNRHVHCNEPCRFTPESGRVRRTSPCPLWAKSGHEPLRCICLLSGAKPT